MATDPKPTLARDMRFIVQWAEQHIDSPLRPSEVRHWIELTEAAARIVEAAAAVVATYTDEAGALHGSVTMHKLRAALDAAEKRDG